MFVELTCQFHSLLSVPAGGSEHDLVVVRTSTEVTMYAGNQKNHLYYLEVICLVLISQIQADLPIRLIKKILLNMRSVEKA